MKDPKNRLKNLCQIQGKNHFIRGRVFLGIRLVAIKLSYLFDYTYSLRVGEKRKIRHPIESDGGFSLKLFPSARVNLRLMIDIPLVEIDVNVNSRQFQPMECLSLIVNSRARVEMFSGNPP